MAIASITKSYSYNPDFENNFSSLENVFDQYMDELNQKQEEIITLISKWEVKQQQQIQRQQTNKLNVTPQKTDSKSALVLELLDKGHDHEQIAQRLGIGKGEVKLISQLKNNKNSIDS